MKSKELKNGFYWIVLRDECDEAEVAEYFNGEWFVTGTKRTYNHQRDLVEVLSPPLVLKAA